MAFSPLCLTELEEDEENKTLLEFIDHPRTKALRELHEMSFVGEWDVSNIQGYQLFETFVDLQKKIRMKFINEVVTTLPKSLLNFKLYINRDTGTTIKGQERQAYNFISLTESIPMTDNMH